MHRIRTSAAHIASFGRTLHGSLVVVVCDLKAMKGCTVCDDQGGTTISCRGWQLAMMLMLMLLMLLVTANRDAIDIRLGCE